MQLFLEQQSQFRSQLNNLLGQTPWTMLNSLTERNLDLWKSFQQGLLNSMPNAGSGTAAGSKPRTPPKSGTR
jgi:hypothetical protein